MKKIIIIILFLTLLIKLSSASCCINQDTLPCSNSSLDLCCPDNKYTNFTHCKNNLFIDKDCNNLSECQQGCCCLIEEKFGVTTNSFIVSTKSKCQGNWVQSNNCPDICGVKNTKSTKKSNTKIEPKTTVYFLDNEVHEKSCRNSIDCGDRMGCQVDISRDFDKSLCCYSSECPYNNKCYAPNDRITYNGEDYICFEDSWKVFDDYLPCKEIDGTCRGDGILNWRTWFKDFKCNKNEEQVTDANCGDKKICCAQEIPDKFDWRNNNGNYVSSVKNQGVCGSCWAFASTAMFESRLMIQEENPNANYDLSEQQIMSCSGITNLPCTGVVDMNDALKYALRFGLVDEECIPYTEGNSDCNWCSNSQNRIHKLKEQSQKHIDFSAPESVKRIIYNEGPITVALSFNTYNQDNVVKCISNLPIKNHAILLIGWDDSLNAYIAKNSWGVAYQDNGFFPIHYYENCFQKSSTTNFIKNPTPLYCDLIGGEFYIDQVSGGERGMCKLPDGQRVEAWDFMNGKVAKEHSYCAQQGWGLLVKTDGKNRFSKEYAVCVLPSDHQGGIGPKSLIPKGNEIQVTDILEI
jgi:putative hemolysin